MPKKTLKLSIDEEHTDFEKFKVTPTKTFDMDDFDVDDDEGYAFLSTSDLEYKLEHEKLTEDEIKKIKHVLSSRK